MRSMLLLLLLLLAVLGISTGHASNITRRAGGCPKYYVVNTRGTGEPQMQSSGFFICNQQLLAKVPGGTLYATRYSANFAQISMDGTMDIINYVTKTLASDPGACFVLEGYSQGAMATTNALPKLTAQFDSIKAIMLIGNPARGLQRAMAPNIDQWKAKVLDICAQADPVCVVPTADGPAFGSHLAYPWNGATQSKMSNFAATALQNAAASGGEASCGAAPAASSTTSTATPAAGGLGGIGKMMGLPGMKRLMMGGMPSMPGMGSATGGGLPGLGGLMGGSTSTPAAGAAAAPAAGAAAAPAAAAGGTGCTSTTSAAPAAAAGAAAPATTAPAASGGLGSLLGGAGGGGMPGLGSLIKMKRDDVITPSSRRKHQQRKKRRTYTSKASAGK